MSVVVVGAGGHGREVFATLSAAGGVDLAGFVDDAPSDAERVARLGSHMLGTLQWLVEHPHDYALGIGTPTTRRLIVELLTGCDPVRVIAATATIGPDVSLGSGVVVFDRSVVTTNVVIGDHTHLNVGCAVQHDSRVGSFVQMSPGVLINGDCVIDDDVFLGTGAVVTRGCRIGAGARVGAGAVVLENVNPAATVVGIPARPVELPRQPQSQR